MTTVYLVEVDMKAARELSALPRSEQRRIMSKLQALAHFPRPSGCVKLSGQSNLWRIRSGVFRIIYQIHDERLLIVVVKVGHRRDVYRGI